MLTLLLVNSISVFIAFLSKFKERQYIFWLVPILLSLVYGIRYDFGNDYWSYYIIFKKSHYGIDPRLVEPGWGLINYICQPIGFFGMVFILTSIENYIVFRYIKLYVSKEYWWISTFIFVFTFNFMLLGCSMMRQYLAMVILITSIKYIVNRDLIRFLIILMLAISIHKTAIVFFPVYFLAFKLPNFRNVKFIIIAVSIFLLLMITSINYIEYFKIAAVMFEDEKFNRYLMGEEGSYSFTIIIDIIWMVLLMRYCKNTRLSQTLCLIALLSYVLLPFTFAVVILLRLMLFFSIYFIFSIPETLPEIKNRILRDVMVIIYLVLIVRRSITTLTGDIYGDFYKSFNTILSAPSWM